MTKYDCRTCGACCDYANQWVEIDPEYDIGVPDELITEDAEFMEAVENRCVALQGEVGKCVKCSIYQRRPRACQTFPEGTKECEQCRRWHGLPTA